MVNVYLPKYDTAREMIRTMKKNGLDWDDIILKYNEILFALDKDVTKEVWGLLVQEQKEEYNRSQHIQEMKYHTYIVSQNEDNDTSVPTGERSSWQLYKQKLLKKGWNEKSVINLEKSTLSILKKLNRNTEKTGPVKGLVVGQVQSGKTSSIAGLIAMAADWGWNTFIVLSGMIDNLREQTENRLISDLNNNGNTTWYPLKNVSKRAPVGSRLQDLNLEENSSTRYLTVCLKNKRRLENLISWLKSDKNKLRQMRLLIIDDEADQASINTKNVEEERARINELIIKLVEIDRDSGVHPNSVNYVCYTATPYANFLNESSPESLYPKDFIGLLPESEEYFGPKQIFGIEGSDEYEGMDIIREISEADVKIIKSIQKGLDNKLPMSLKESICWFICATASMRFYGIRKPFSMMVHTSQIKAHHSNIADSIKDWIEKSDENELLRICEKVYSRETSTFTAEKFKNQFPDYPIQNSEFHDYPDFQMLIPYIKDLISRISYIMMGGDGELHYHKGIHLCIDNSDFNGINEENMHIRLTYPTKEQIKDLGTAPAFIIIGGNTLSRGLTLEGLVSTYFLRAATAADSLMQMGRWFGYRKGYELFPRIWMSKDTYDKFLFLTVLDEELREELREFSIGHKNPSEYGPRVKNTPKASWLRITARNKMQQAEEVEMDFTGASIQTIHFDNDYDILKYNIDLTEYFLSICGKPLRSYAGNAIFFKGISFDKIKNEFLLKMKFNTREKVFNQIESFCEWYEKVREELNFTDWNVVVAGSGKVKERLPKNDKEWYIEPYTIGKVERSAKYNSMNYSKDMVNIGVLRGPGDVFADIEDENFHKNIKQQKNMASNKVIRAYREKYGLGKVPQLIIYRIYKNSKARKSDADEKQHRRTDLNFVEDIIGIYINIPGDSTGKPHPKALRIRMDKTEDNE
jgi:hypothetical protein